MKKIREEEKEKLKSSFLEASVHLEDDECKSARASGVRVGLEVDVVDLAVLAKVLLDVQVLCLLRETSNK